MDFLIFFFLSLFLSKLLEVQRILPLYVAFPNLLHYKICAFGAVPLAWLSTT